MALCLLSVQAPAGGNQEGEADADTLQAELQPQPVEHHEELHRQRAFQDPHAGEGLTRRGGSHMPGPLRPGVLPGQPRPPAWPPAA